MTGSGVVEIDKLMAAGRELAYTGEELKVWVEREKNIQREERLQAREAAREEHAAQERACQAECVRVDKEREVLQLRIAAQERGNREARGEGGEGGSTGPSHSASPHKLIPQYNEKRDDLDAYLQRFERTATGLGWPQDKWATTLSLCLTGEALTVVGRMTPADAMDYTKMKLALLQRFRYTKEGY
ncbi:uncharacterized protein ISCGN_016542 [Ixodes scapularis]